MSEFSISPILEVFLHSIMSEFCLNLSEFCLNFCQNFVWIFVCMFVLIFVWDKTPKRVVKPKNEVGKSILRDKFLQSKHLSNGNAEKDP